MSLDNHPKYRHYWAVAYAFSSSEQFKYITVNDGGGNLGISINENYIYSTFILNSI